MLPTTAPAPNAAKKSPAIVELPVELVEREHRQGRAQHLRESVQEHDDAREAVHTSRGAENERLRAARPTPPRSARLRAGTNSSTVRNENANVAAST